MPNDSNFILQALITDGKVLTLTEIDPETTYLQVGVWQANQLKAGSAGNAYPSFAIPVSELLKGPKAFRALLTDGTTGATLNVLEDGLSEGAGYLLKTIPCIGGPPASRSYQLIFTNPVLITNRTALPSSGNFAGAITQDTSCNILAAPEVVYKQIDATTIEFSAFNLGQVPSLGYMVNHYLEILVFP
jgi:hypothetical protein